jgi:hypothetical protein
LDHSRIASLGCREEQLSIQVPLKATPSADDRSYRRHRPSVELISQCINCDGEVTLSVSLLFARPMPPGLSSMGRGRINPGTPLDPNRRQCFA